MFLVPLAAVPNQQLSFNIDNSYWQIRIYQAIDTMVADVARDGVQLITATRCFVGQGILPYAYQYEPNFGNLVFDNDPDWEKFGAGCSLYYLSFDEYTEFQAELLQ